MKFRIHKLLQVIGITSVLAVINLAATVPAYSQYRVSGVVEFSYRGLETKSGDFVTQDQQYWTQTYRANLSGHVIDPRFLRFTAGAGYMIHTYKDAADRDEINYSLHTTFFPGLRISWDLFGSKTTQNVESTASIAGYDVDTTTYGGMLRLRLGRNNGRNNRNNRNNWNNNNGGPLPSFILSHIHTESESRSLTTPYDEVRDDSRGTINYRVNSAFDINLDAGYEQYENRVQGSSYDTKTAGLRSNLRLGEFSDLKIIGKFTERETENITGYNPSDTIWSSGVLLDARERNGLRQYYRYDYTEQKTKGPARTTLAIHTVDGWLLYRIAEPLQVKGGIEYKQSDYASPIEESTLKSGGLSGGILYQQKVSPPFLLPLVLNADYDIALGTSDVTVVSGPLNAGDGMYYTNNVSIGVSSDGWDKENLTLGYSFNNKRDRSPVKNNIWGHAYRASISSYRIPRTSLRGSTTYISREESAGPGSVFIVANPGTNQQGRAFLYDVIAEHTLSAYTTLAAGASRSDSTNTLLTLSTLAPASTTRSIDDIYYGSVFFTYPIARNLLYRANLREEFRSTSSGDTRNHQVNMYLDYRIRSIIVNLEYRWRQDIPDFGNRTEQQLIYAKISRPF